MTLDYMRDNHTFKALDEDIEKALVELRKEWSDGWTSGMLCSKEKALARHSAFFRHDLSWEVNAEAARKWFAEAYQARAEWVKTPEPCPFCGERDNIEVLDNAVVCERCNASIVDDDGEALPKWNSRT